MTAAWQYGGRAYPFAVGDGASMERMKEALRVLKESEIGEGEEPREAYCRMIGTFFDTLFGEGTGAVLCGEDEDAASDAYLSFTEYAAAQLDTLREAREEAEERYLSRAEEAGNEE